MAELPAIRRLDGVEALRIHETLQAHATQYLASGGVANPYAFALWAVHEGVWFLELPEGVVMLTDYRPGHSARIHPVAWGKKLVCDSTYTSSVLRHLVIQCKIIRIDALIPSTEHESVERWARRCGFQYEGTLRSALARDGKFIDGKLYARIGDYDGNCDI